MKRLLALAIAVLVFSGCSGQTPPASDPFLFGRTRVPAPPTGAISGAPTNPYFRAAPNSAPPQSPVPPVRSGAVPRPVISLGSPTSKSSGASAPATRLAEREPVVQVLQPRPERGAESSPRGFPRSVVPSAPREPQRLNLSTQPVDIMDLPPARTSGTVPRAESTSGSEGFRLASGTEEPDGSAGATAASFTSQSLYGHDPNYQWIRGQIEYSQIDRLWKLRYIPVDGATDDFGGSVVLADPKVLSGYERGEFVEIHGRVMERNPETGYAPTYEVAEIKPLGGATP